MKQGFIAQANYYLTPVKLTDKLFFTKNLSLMVKSGITLNDALKSLKLQTPNLKLKTVLTDVSESLQKGESFSDSLKKHPKIFSEIFINMVNAGEESGKLEEVLKTLSIQLHKDHDLRSKVKGALAYPVVVLTAMVLITGGLLVFVIPNLTRMFTESGLELPLPTKILIAVSNFAKTYFYVVIALVVAGVTGFIKLRKMEAGKKVLHKMVLKAPVLGLLAQKVNIARITRTLASLLNTDIPVVKSFRITSNVTPNYYYKTALRDVGKQLKTGSSIHKAMKKYEELFTATVVQMVLVGEETGALDEMLKEIAIFYEEDLDNTLKNLPSLLEPLLILMLGFTVGGIAVAIMLPIFSFTQNAVN